MREAKGFTQGQVAEALDWSLSKVQRIESGDVTVSSTDLKALLGKYELLDSKKIEQLIDVARASRRKGWWDEPRFRQHLTPSMMQLLQFEAEASAVRVYHPTLVPGLLQTPAYADSILGFWHELTDEDRAVRFEVRMRRREFLLSRPDPPHYYFVFDESVLLREVGGPDVMAEQLNSLLSMTGHPTVMVRILPFAAAANLAELGHFQIIDLGDEENAILYREAQLADDIEQTPARVALYRRRFEFVWDAALTEEATARLIKTKAAAMIADLAREGPDR
jgi:transcriptional regulator with XRE-family HTH domain